MDDTLRFKNIGPKTYENQNGDIITLTENGFVCHDMRGETFVNYENLIYQQLDDIKNFFDGDAKRWPQHSCGDFSIVRTGDDVILYHRINGKLVGAYRIPLFYRDVYGMERRFQEEEERELREDLKGSRYMEEYLEALRNLKKFEDDVDNAKTIREALSLTSGPIYGHNYDPENGYAYIVFCRYEDGSVELCTKWTAKNYFDGGVNLDMVVDDEELDEPKSVKLLMFQDEVGIALDYYRQEAYEYWIEGPPYWTYQMM